MITARAYKIIVILLVFCVVSILVLQAWWIRHTFIQKKEAFNQQVYAVMEEVSKKLDARDQLHYLKQSVITSKQDDSSGNSMVKVIVSSSTASANITPEWVNNTEVKIDKLDSVFGLSQIIKTRDSNVKIENGKSTVIIRQTASNKPDKKSINKLIDRMMVEIQRMDVSPLTKLTTDTLKQIIQREFDNKGISTPFEFSLRQITTHEPEKVLLQSKGFDGQKEILKYNLSLHNIINANQWLWLSFPSSGSFVFSTMKGVLILSLGFSLLFIGVVLYTLRLLSKQKKVGRD